MNPRYALLAACMAHVEGYYSTKSSAFVHNNPGNLAVHEGRTYATKLEGWQALHDDITANAGSPLRRFIAKYAPPSENDTSMYLTIVSTLSGIGMDETL